MNNPLVTWTCPTCGRTTQQPATTATVYCFNWRNHPKAKPMVRRERAS